MSPKDVSNLYEAPFLPTQIREVFGAHIANQRAIDVFLSMVEDEPALLLENHTVVDRICRTPIEQKVWRSAGKGFGDGP